MKEYLYKEWISNNHIKYIHLFEEWFNNLTETQKLYYSSYSSGNKSPFTYD